MTFLAIDVGNTRLKWACYADAKVGIAPFAQGVEFLEHIDRLSEGAWRSLPAPDVVLGCVVAGDAVRRMVEEQLEMWDVQPQWVVASSREAGVINGYDHPTRLGPDRWVAMIGARQRLLTKGESRPLVVVVVGTAVTVDALDQDGRFLGGLILPGHGIMLKALEAGTAGLHVPTGDVRMFPTNTSDALTSGGTYAIAGAVQRMMEHLNAHCGGVTPLCIMSGGAGWKMLPSMLGPVDLAEMLIFEGLLQIAAERRQFLEAEANR